MGQLTLEAFIQVSEPTKQCTVCKEIKSLDKFNKDSTRKDGHSYICKECNSKRGKKYYMSNLDDVRKKHNEYYIETKDARSLKYKEYRESHKEERKKYLIEYQMNNKHKIAMKNRRLYIRKRDEYLERCRDYRHSDLGKLTNTRAKSKRRNLGFNPINERFEGAHYHHLRYDANGNADADIGIYIPENLHRSVWHNGNTGQGMEEMNKLAIEWYLSTCKSNSKELLKLGFNSVEEFVERYHPSI